MKSLIIPDERTKKKRKTAGKDGTGCGSEGGKWQYDHKMGNWQK